MEPTTSPPSTPQSPLLTLPRELRDIIYTQLLADTHHEPPHSPDDAGPRTPSHRGPGAIHHGGQSPRPALLQLALCSRQLHAETGAAVEGVALHRERGPAEACLDLMVQSHDVWPTWTALPASPEFPPELRVKLRVFDAQSLHATLARTLHTLVRTLVLWGPCRLATPASLSTPNSRLAKALLLGKILFDVELMFPTSVAEGRLFGQQVLALVEKLANGNLGVGQVGMVEVRVGEDVGAAWRLEKWPTGVVFARRVECAGER